MSPRNSFTVAQKHEAVEFAKKSPKLKAAKHFKVRGILHPRLDQELRDRLVENPGAKRLGGAGRRLTSEGHEGIIFERIIYERSLNYRATRKMITNWGAELSKFSVQSCCFQNSI